MHRTVFEFLRDETIWELGCLKVEAGNKFDIATNLSLGRLHLAMQSLQAHVPDEGQALSCLRDGVRWGSKADRDAPLSRENIFWKMMPFLDLLHARGFAGLSFTLRNPFLDKLTRAHLHGRVDQFSHATVTLATEAGAVNYLKEHPCLLAVSEKCESTLDCQHLFFQVINLTSLLGIYWDNPSSSSPGLRECSSDAVVRLLLSVGCDPNKFVSDGCGMSTSSPWVLGLGIKHKKLGTTIQEKLGVLTTIESFLAAGAKARPGVSFDVETWIKESFREPELIERSQSVLQRYRELETGLTVGSRRRRDDSDELGVRERVTKRVYHR
ncbi:hypothetical protein FALCPG4_002050 [Fusarium falciforme]